MRQQPIPDDSFSEAEAMRIVRGLSHTPMTRPAEDEDNAASCARSVLARTVEDEVIPRLLKASRPQQPPQAAQACPVELDTDHVAELVRLLLTGTQLQVSAYIETLQTCGAGPDSLLLDLLTRSAKRLGEMWEEDLCDFTQVTIGVTRLNNVMRLICAAFDAEPLPVHDAPSALLVQAPGEQHGLGLAMVVHFFRRAGWMVRSEPTAASDDLVNLVGQTWFDVVGISVSCSERMDLLAAAIAAVRSTSRNRGIFILVGGPPFIEHPQLVDMIGADGTAADARLAVQQAQHLIARQGRKSLARDQ